MHVSARQLVMMVMMCLCALQCVWLILCAKNKTKNAVQLSQGCFVCTLFSVLILSPTENNYSPLLRAVEGQHRNQPHFAASEDVSNNSKRVR